MTTAIPEELPPGFEFGGYVIHACIGRGGMAHVYRSEHASLHRAVALKVLDRWVLDKPAGSQRFLREARTAAAIKHPNVVDIADVGVWQERPYIVMELLSGCDLESFLCQHGALSDTEVAGLALPVIAGMIAVHDAGVVHRDIKPSNIFLCNGADGEIVPKVLDFGISKFSDSLNEPIQGPTKTREIVGTPTYMAPEALNGVRELGPHADQYALGAVLYECAVGRPPFEGATLLELLKAIALGAVPTPRSIHPGISIALEDAISRAMNAKPEARFATLRDLGRALWPLADERTRTIWAPSFGNGVAPRAWGQTEGFGLVRQAAQRGRPKRSRRRLLWVPVLAAAAALGALFAFRSTHPADAIAPNALASNSERPPVVEQHSLLGGTSSAAKVDDKHGIRADGIQADGIQADGIQAESAEAENVRRGAAEEEPIAMAVLGERDDVAAAGDPAPVARRSKSLRRRDHASARDNASTVASAVLARAVGSASDPQKAQRSENEADSTDADLETLFVEPPPSDPESMDPELQGIFPADKSVRLGTNGSPLLD
jgi:eukaryotic-like serine/threonine-protein kinase